MILIINFTVNVFVVDLERGPLSLTRIIEELLEWKVAAPVKKTELTTGVIRCADYATLSTRKSWH
jgi:hypothetical protein